MKKEKQNEKIDVLSDWEWTTLVAAWRYYEYGHTIAAVTFPSEIVKRFWGEGNNYSYKARQKIAHQFAIVDHGSRGEDDWKPHDSTGKIDCFHFDERNIYDNDRAAWCTFYAFCKGYVEGFSRIKASNGKITDTFDAFHTEFTDRWTPVEKYINGFDNVFVPKEYIKSIS